MRHFHLLFIYQVIYQFCTHLHIAVHTRELETATLRLQKIGGGGGVENKA